jgi:3',5'-cyclic AMP phosphodiesterase CpdA
LGELLLQAELAGLLQREQLGELRNLRSKARERGVFAGDLLGEVELHDHEHGEQEDDAEDQRRQRVDEAGPIIHAAVAACACKSHVVLT